MEEGKFGQTEIFFENVLKDQSNNKTALLCYGRAVGLNGNASKAIDLFSHLLEDYPEDLEVKLNYGESLLWNKDYAETKTYYIQLITEAPENFSVLLGYANTLSNLKDYENATIYINKALEISPENPNTLTSKKFIYLGHAYQYQQSQNYAEAEALLTKTLELYYDDKDCLLNLANLYLISDQIEDAKAIYNRLAEQPEHKILALNGLALVAHLNNKEKKAIDLSSKAFNNLSNNSDKTTVRQTTERYIQALIWNKKYKPAKNLIDSLIGEQPDKNWILAFRATLNIYKSNFKYSLRDYNEILENDSTSFDGNLGKANVLKALGYYDEAYIWAENTLTYYPNQKDALNFIDQMDISFTPALETKAAPTFDNGNNKAFTGFKVHLDTNSQSEAY